MEKGEHFWGGLGPLNPEEEGGAGGPRLSLVMFAECVKSRWDGRRGKRLVCRVLGSESKLSQTNACSSALSRGASQIQALEGKGHSSERMTTFSPKAASFRAVAPPAPATECSYTKKSMVLTAREMLPHSLIWHNYKFLQYIVWCALLFQQKLFGHREFFIVEKKVIFFPCSLSSLQAGSPPHSHASMIDTVWGCFLPFL